MTDYSREFDLIRRIQRATDAMSLVQPIALPIAALVKMCAGGMRPDTAPVPSVLAQQTREVLERLHGMSRRCGT